MKDIFTVVTNRILTQLNKGIIPWRRPWSSHAPTSYQTNKEYQGINALILQDTYNSPYWLTFRQAQKLGGSIKAGEKGSQIVFVDKIIKEETNPDGSTVTRVIPIIKYYTVFNWEQTKNIPEKTPIERDNTTIQDAETMLRFRDPRINYHPSKAYYSSTEDIIYLPDIKQFESSASYYSTAFHELTHWTGAKSRLARTEAMNYHLSDKSRSQEELTAEMGAAFLCKMCAIDTTNTVENSTAYIKSWLEVLKQNPKWVLKASRQAREAVEFIQTGQRRAKEF